MHRAAPNFFLVGAPQAGTTSLYASLDQHPSVFMCPIKEPCFFAPEVADVTPRARQLYDADAAALRRYLDGPLTAKRGHGLVLDWDDYRSLFRHLRGETAIGEASVAIATRSPHRGDAYAACRYAIERIKQIAPIWKHEFFEGGEVWIEGATANPDDGVARAQAERIACA